MYKKSEGFTLIELLIVVAIIGIIAAIAIPSFVMAIDNAKRKATMAELRSYGNALAAYTIENSVYPADTNNIMDLYGELVPYAVNTLSTQDKWAHDFVYDAASDVYTVSSLGKNGVPGLVWDPMTIGYASFDLDIMFSDGQFVSP